jgi:hypothetical protein
VERTWWKRILGTFADPVVTQDFEATMRSLDLCNQEFEQVVQELMKALAKIRELEKEVGESHP